MFSASNCFVCYYRLLKFTLRKNRLNTVYAGVSIQQERCPLVWKLVGHTFNHCTYLCKDVQKKQAKRECKSRSVQHSIALRLTYFKINRLYLTSSRLYAKKFSFDKSQVWNRLFTKDCVTRTKILLVSFLFYVMFQITLGLLLPKEGVQQRKKHQYPCPILLEFCHSSHLLCKNHKKPQASKKM